MWCLAWSWWPGVVPMATGIFSRKDMGWITVDLTILVHCYRSWKTFLGPKQSCDWAPGLQMVAGSEWWWLFHMAFPEHVFSALGFPSSRCPSPSHRKSSSLGGITMDIPMVIVTIAKAWPGSPGRRRRGRCSQDFGHDPQMNEVVAGRTGATTNRRRLR